MPDETAPSMSPAQPAGGTGVAPDSTMPPPGTNQDKSDAMTYPVGSHSAQQQAGATEEDHRSILDRIMGIFSKNKTPEQPKTPQAPQATQPGSTPPQNPPSTGHKIL